MHWKTFRAEFESVKKHYSRHPNPEHCALKFLASIMLGEIIPERIDALATGPWKLSLLPKAREQLALSGSSLPFPLVMVIKNWVAKFSRRPELLGECYQRLVADPRRRGMYYTPAPVVDYIVRNTVSQSDIVVNPYVKILDPACGCGFFLLQSYDVLWQKYIAARDALQTLYPQMDWSDLSIHRHIIRNNLWGADIDPLAVEIAEFYFALKGLALASSSLDEPINPNLLVCDSLADNRSQHRQFWTAQYDFVIGNPPYLSFGFRGAKGLDKNCIEVLRLTYVVAEYKMSYYVLFLQRGIDLLKDGGLLGYIVPDSFLNGRYYSKIRRYILANTNIRSLTYIDTPVFPQAAAGLSLICILEKKLPAAEAADNTVTVFRALNVDNLNRVQPACSYQQNYFGGLPHCRFRLYFDLKAKHIVDKIESRSLPMGKFAAGHAGIRSLTRQSDIVGEARLGETWVRGLVSGSQVKRYGIVYKGHWLNIDPRLVYKGGWQETIVQQPKILMRQTGHDLIASIDREGYYHLNNIHSFVLVNDDISLEYLIMLLNSRLMAFYYHVVTMEYNRPFAQVDIETIESLPICINDQINTQAGELVRLMMDCVRRQLAGDKAAATNVVRLDDYFDQIVYRVYDLTDEEVAYITAYEQTIVRGGWRRRKRK